MLKIKIKPITNWIGAETKYPSRSQFKAAYSQTKKLLEKELENLNSIESTQEIAMFINPEDLRNDGDLRANRRPYKHGVILSFLRLTGRTLRNNVTGDVRRETQTLSYPCDKFDDWQDNVRAIALSLEALRKVARYGVFSHADMVERLALPPAEGRIADRQTAAEFISRYSDLLSNHIESDAVAARNAYRQAAIRLHPDRQDGSHELFLNLQKAKEILGI